MDRIHRRAIAVASVVAFVAVVLALTLYCVIPCILNERECAYLETDANRLPVELEMEFRLVTNDISQAFRDVVLAQHTVIPCACRTLEVVKAATNATFRLAVTRHLAGELLALNITNENYRVRWQNLGAAEDSIHYVFEALWRSEAPEMEQCKFLFDALQRFKEGAIATLDEGPPSRSDYGRHGKDPFWAQGNCKKVAQKGLEGAPCTFNNGEFSFLYPRLSPGAQEYFKKRFREVFGLDYRPEENGKRPWLWGLDGTRWDGKGLEWR